jgi:hypothetical protein
MGFSSGSAATTSTRRTDSEPELVAEADGNRTRLPALAGHSGFEGMSSLPAPARPLASGFVFRRRPRTYEDL